MESPLDVILAHQGIFQLLFHRFGWRRSPFRPRLRIDRPALQICWRQMGLKKFPRLRLEPGDLMDGSWAYYLVGQHTIIAHLDGVAQRHFNRHFGSDEHLHRRLVSLLAHESYHALECEQGRLEPIDFMEKLYRCLGLFPVVWLIFLARLSVPVMSWVLVGVTALASYQLWHLLSLAAQGLYNRFGHQTEPCERRANRFATRATRDPLWRQVVTVSVKVVSQRVA